MAAADVTAAVLRNKGAPVRLIAFNGEGEPALTEDDAFTYETRWVRLDAACIAAMEEAFEELDENGLARDINLVFAQRLTRTPMKTMAFVLSLALRISEEEALRRLDPPLKDEYATALGAAYSIAMGVDPEVAKKVFESGLMALAEEQQVKQAALLDAMKVVGMLPGTDGSTPGVEQVEVSMSSGL